MSESALLSHQVSSVEERASAAPKRTDSLRRVFAIARNSFREAVRDRVLYNLVLFVLLLTGAAIFIGDLSAGSEAKIIVDVGLSATLLFGAFIAIFVGTSFVHKEIERRTIYAIFSKPVSRAEFLVGKYLGLCSTLAVNVVVMGAGLSLALVYVAGGRTPLALTVWAALALIYLELVIITAFALLFSSFSSPILSALLAFAIFVVGHFSLDLKQLAASLGTAPARAVVGALYYLLPNFANYSFITPAGHGAVPSLASSASAVLYAVLYVAVLLAAATLVIDRRNFK